ncbi:excisionase family DNA-binding protein [Pseudonocardia xinjiangensis]|uniref:excisionase family DNA-binding protein n=1 Tax=Pseudonocardia xinjiangensis TaxID=75289 RepID=UPI003D8AE530
MRRRHRVTEYLSTSDRFVRRLIAERRIRFYRVGRHIRFSVADLRAFAAEGCVEPITAQSVRRHVRGLSDGTGQQAGASALRADPQAPVRPVPGLLPGTRWAPSASAGTSPLPPRHVRQHGVNGDRSLPSSGTTSTAASARWPPRSVFLRRRRSGGDSDPAVDTFDECTNFRSCNLIPGRVN